MEMSNNLIPELHVAQQRRRDKLRVQQFDELQATGNNFHHLPPGNTNSNNTTHQKMLLPPEMLSFTASHPSTPFPNIHPTRFITPSSSDSCDPQQTLQNCENWVPIYNNVHHHGRGTTHLSSVLPQIDYQTSVSSWGNELPLLPANFVSQGTDTGMGMGMNMGVDTNSHVLSLSLSSNKICDYQHHLGDIPRELKPFESGSISSVVKQQCNSSTSGGNLECGNSNNQVPDIAGTSMIHSMHRNVGPLGPFTGYAAILKSSKFLKPAQLLLDDLFGAAGLWRVGQESENGSSVPTSRSHNMGECSTGVASKIHPSCSDLNGRSSSPESYRPDCHERKAKLLHMQEEVCKRHKQYHQQMQLVISAFDSVPGLSNATPYISRSIKTITRHFRCLKNAIADQLRHIRRALGEDLSSPTSFLKGDSSSSLMFDQNFAKVKSSSVGGMAHVGPQNHVWRPQRGLPERAVSVLRAWLFDHFLHPYPTDNDKQMLATQTGLTRNQVSNWFINARVRLWKPMVEEIHMLETKGGSRSEPSSNNNVRSVIEKNRQAAVGNQSSCKSPVILGACDGKQLECSEPSTSLDRPRGETTNTEQLFQKCSRIETHQVPGDMDSSLMGFLPYQRRGLELGGIGGAVSLTLGLRHGSEVSQHQQLQHQFLPQGMPFGGHVIHDFSG